MPSSGCKTCALDRKSTRLNSSHTIISYAVFCLKKQKDLALAGFAPPPGLPPAPPPPAPLADLAPARGRPLADAPHRTLDWSAARTFFFKAPAVPGVGRYADHRAVYT